MRLATLAITSLLLSSQTYSFEDTSPMPMMAEPQQEDSVDNEASNQEIVRSFSTVYKKKGKPRLAVFWNRKFDDQLSQWEQVARGSVSMQASLETEGHLPSSESEKDANGKALAKALGSAYIERKNPAQYRHGLGETSDFEFGSGFVQRMSSAGTKIIDRSTIMRLMQSNKQDTAGAEVITDRQVVETDALKGYADYIAELVFTRNSSAPVGMSFLVTVKDINTGEIVTMFKSDGEPPTVQQKAKLQVTDHGYDYVDDNNSDINPTDVGGQIALEMMSALTQVWIN